MFNEVKKSIQWGEETLTLETGKVARFQCQRLFAPLDRFFDFVEHLFILSGSERPSVHPVEMAAPLPPTPLIISCAGVRASRLR